MPSEASSQVDTLPRIYSVASFLLILVALVYLCQLFSTILQQLFTAVFLVCLIHPAHRWLVRHGVPSFASLLLIGLAVAASFVLAGSVVANSFEDLQVRLPLYQDNLTRLLENASARLPGVDSEFLLRFFQVDSPGVDRGVDLLRTALRTLADFFSQILVVLVFLAFLLAELASLQKRIDRAFEPQRAQQVLDVIGRIADSIVQYMWIKTLMSVLSGVLTALVLVAFGVDYPLLWGFLALLLNYIPYLGSIVAVALPVLLSLAQFDSPWRALVILVLLLLVQNAIAYLIEPRLAGRQLDLSPLIIILSLSFWGFLWGVIGVILAVPLTVFVKMILENVPATRPIAVLLSNPAE